MRTDHAVLRDASRTLGDAGLSASIVVRDLRHGNELALDADAAYPLASVVKLPLALAVLRAGTTGAIDLAERVELDPDVTAASATSTRITRSRWPTCCTWPCA